MRIFNFFIRTKTGGGRKEELSRFFSFFLSRTFEFLRTISNVGIYSILRRLFLVPFIAIAHNTTETNRILYYLGLYDTKKALIISSLFIHDSLPPLAT